MADWVGMFNSRTDDFSFMKKRIPCGFGWNSSQPVRSCRHWIRRWLQFGNEQHDVGEEVSQDSNLGHLEGDIVAMADDLATNLDELLLQAGQRQVRDRLGRCQGAQEFAEVVGESRKLKLDCVGRERPA